jgi:diguanylate cyclase
MAEGADDSVHLPVRAVPGPLHPLSFRAHMMVVQGRSQQALRAADDYEPLIRAAGDEITLSFLDQVRMYALHQLGRYHDALAAGVQALRRRREQGWVIGEAKTLADIAELHFFTGDLAQGLHALARATTLLDRRGPSEYKYLSALHSLVGTARSAELYELAESLLRQVLARVGGDGMALLDTLLLPQHFDVADAVLPAYGDLQLEWGLRLDQLGRAQDAADRFTRCVALIRTFLKVTSGCGSDLTGPIEAQLALALAKLGAADEAIALARGLVVRQRDERRYHNAALPHLAYGVALRTSGDLAGARRELAAAEQFCDKWAGRTIWRLTLQYETVLLATADLPPQVASRLLTAVHAQAERLWEMRLRGVSMLREVRRQQELEVERATAMDAVMRDELTGVGNRRHFDLLLAGLDNGGAPEPGRPMVLLLLDVDNFKNVNDRYSHSVGDRVLAEFGAILRANCGLHDVAVRFGGDEFALFVQADLPYALEVADRIRRSVLDRDWSRLALGLRVTVSTGAAAYDPALTSRRLFDVADRCLYEAKRRGRNRVVA